MKHARKMILVDASSHGNALSQNLSKNIDPLTQAIKSLANATEFSKTQYGPRTTVVSRLSNELGRILQRKDLDPSSKLKLYNHELKRFLFLHHDPKIERRNADNSTVTRLPEPVHPVDDIKSISDVEMNSVYDDDTDDDNATEYADVDVMSIPDSEYGAVGGYQRTPVAISTPSSPEEIFTTPKKRPSTSPDSRPKRYKSNLPRTTPKHEILRQNRKLKRLGSFDYFEDWVSNRRRRKL